jgi:hypothetical protein
MKIQNQHHVVWIVGICSFIAVLMRAEEPAQEPKGEYVVAVVNSVPILHSSIDLPNDAAREQFIYKHGHSPVDESDMKIMEEIRHRYRLKRLTISIQTTIRKQEIARFGIKVTENDIATRWEQLVQDRDPPETITRNRLKAAALLAALNAVFDQSEDPEHVYETKLEGKASREEWEMLLRSCNIPKWRLLQEKALEAGLNHDVVFDESMQDGVRRLVIREKLDEAIEDELIRIDPEFSEYNRLAKTDPTNEKVQSKGPNYRAAKRYLWWQQRYREAHIEIKDERFREAMQLITEGDAAHLGSPNRDAANQGSPE